MKLARILLGALAVAALLSASAAQAQPGTTYRVTITNLTRAQPVTPPVVATHSLAFHVFLPGTTASDALALLAEEGDTSELVADLEAAGGVLDVAVGEGPLMPGQSTTVEVQAHGRHVFLSVVGMLATTNDAFFGLEGYSLKGNPRRRHVEVPAYDAGSEENNELCAFIPGPPCMSPGVRATDGAEGIIAVHSGIHGIGDLPPEVWDWRNPVVRIDIVRLAGNQGE